MHFKKNRNLGLFAHRNLGQLTVTDQIEINKASPKFNSHLRLLKARGIPIHVQRMIIATINQFIFLNWFQHLLWPDLVRTTYYVI